MPQPSGYRDEIVRQVTLELERAEAGTGGPLTTLDELARCYKLSPGTISNYLRAAGLSDRREHHKRAAFAPGARDQGTLVRMVEEELERFKRGEKDFLSTIGEFAERTGFSSSSVNMILRAEGLLARRSEARRARQAEWLEQLTPSADYAWLLGLLIHGSIEESVITYTSTSQTLLAEFKRCGERVFGLPGHRTPYPNRDFIGGGERLRFCSMALVQEIGDLRPAAWAQTLTIQHPWVMGDARYLWRFLSGYLERGSAVTARHIVFYTISKTGATYLIEALSRVGVQQPKFLQNKKSPEGIGGVIVYDLRDRKLLAAHLDCRSPEKVAALRAQREIPARRVADDVLIAEWQRLEHLLGAIPVMRDVQRLFKGGQTQFSPAIYKYRFGDGTWGSTRGALEHLIAEREGRAVRWTPSQSPNKEELIAEWSRMHQLLGRAPGRNTIYHMKRRGETPFGPGVYIRHFSQNGHFTGAVDTLQAIVSQLYCSAAPTSDARRAQMLRDVTSEVEEMEQGGRGTLTTVEQLARRYELDEQLVANCIKTTGLSERRRHAKRVAVVRLAEGELAQLERGEIQALSTTKELADQVGVSACHVSTIMAKEGLMTRRREAESAAMSRRLAPSEECAWLLGLLTKGFIDLHGGAVTYGSSNEALLAEFEQCGERVFGLPPKRRQLPEWRGRVFGQRAVFSGMTLANAIGDLRSTAWAETLRTRYPWIMSEERFAWRFLSSVLDGSGSVDEEGISFRTPSLAGASYVMEVLSVVGVKHARLSHCPTSRDGVDGVAVYRIGDRRLLAAHLRCFTETKEAGLRALRALPPKRGEISDEDLIIEWLRLRTMGGAPLTANGVTQLQKSGATPYSAAVYMFRFGEGIWSTANSVLEKTVAEREGRSLPPPPILPTRTELEAAWVAMVQHFGRVPSYKQVLWRYQHGQTPYHPADYGRCFGTFKQVATELSQGPETDRKDL